MAQSVKNLTVPMWCFRLRFRITNLGPMIILRPIQNEKLPIFFNQISILRTFRIYAQINTHFSEFYRTIIAKDVKNSINLAFLTIFSM